MDKKRAIKAVAATILLKRQFNKSLDSSSSSDSEDLTFYKIGSKKARIKEYLMVVNQYSDMDFKSHFRITRSTLEIILKLILPCYRHSSRIDIDIQSGRPPVSPKTAVLFSIWVISNIESFRGVSDRFGIERGHGHRIFILICKLFNTHLKKQYIKWPKGPALQKKAEEFNSLRPNGMPGVVGCVDGSHIKIPAPSRADNSYFNRKGYHSVLIQAVCDARKIFLDIYCGWPGSANDARMWSASPLAKYLSKEPCPLPDNFHLLGDSAYPLETYLMCPFKDNGHLSQEQKVFNTKLSSSRVVVEQAFGLLKGRWRRLQCLDIKNIGNAKHYIMIACILHNIAIEHNDFIEYGEDLDDNSANIKEIEQGILIEENRNIRLIRAQRKRDNIMNSL